jgi:diguanylate cyclase (GGDEF)-like protein
MDLLDHQSSEKLRERICRNNDDPFVMQARKKDGEQLYLQGIDLPYHYNGTMIRIGLVKDITVQMEREKRMEYLAFYDELTDLPNRNFFVKVLKEEIHQVQKNKGFIAIYYLNLDYFKEINETGRYNFGDQLLKMYSAKLKTFLTANIFIAKVSGDEFIVMRQNLCTEDEATNFAQKMIAEFEKPVNIDALEVTAKISIGISVHPIHGKNAVDLISHAKAAMQAIREKHQNNYKLFETSILENFKSMLTMESELRKGLKKKQFEIHYQPQKSVKSGEIVGLEALLRWNHPQKGRIPPMDFIPLAERTGLIIEIGEWVIYEACKQNKKWQEEGYEPMVVGVNLSMVQLRQKNLIEKVKRILQETGLDPKYLELEITESMSMANEENVLATIKDFHQLGVSVSIDDFGTGYSSLKYLSMFPITKLKIDKMFMDDKQEQNQAIVKSIIHLSHALDIKVIAEGVETKEQFIFLEQEKCDEIQGFYFSKPLPPHELNPFFRRSW